MNLASSLRVQPNTGVPREAVLPRIVAIGVVVGAIAAMVLYLVLALQWRNQPFIGFLISPTLVVNPAVTSSGDVPWSGAVAGLRPGDQLLSINGVALDPVPGNYEQARTRLQETLSSLQVGDTVSLSYSRRSETGQLQTGNVTYPLTTFPDGDFFVLFILPYITGLIILAIAMVLVIGGAGRAGTFEGVVMFSLLSLISAGFFDIGTTHQMVHLWILASSLIGTLLISIGMTFPVKLRALYMRPWLAYIPLVIGLGIGVLAVGRFDTDLPGVYSPAVLIGVATLFIGTLGFPTLEFVQFRRANTPEIRNQVGILLIGIALSSLPVILWVFARVVEIFIPDFDLNLTLEVLMPFLLPILVSYTYVVLGTGLVDADRLFRQTLTYSLLLFMLVFGYFLLTFGASLIAVEAFSANNPILIGLMLFLVAVLFIPVRSLIQGGIDELFFRQRLNYQEKQEEFSRELSTLSGYNRILRQFRRVLDESLTPDSLFVFLPNAQASGEFVSVGELVNQTNIEFTKDSGVADLLRKRNSAVYLEPGKPLPAELIIDRARLNILKTKVLAGLRTGTTLNGIVSLGASRSGKPYNYEELRFINSVVGQLAIAIERTQAIDSLERRVRELDVLSQVGQAVNFTIEFDDLLELISTRTARLIESSHFYIALYDANLRQLYFAFYLENDERYTEKENQRWPLGNDVFSDIVRTGQPRRIGDYAKATSGEGYSVLYDNQNIKAWMGVPLLAGQTTLGVLAIGNNKANETFTEDQFRIFSNIGTLAATSLDKARLFSEVNVRARQLAALNEISQKLVVAEAGDVEELLQLITRSAVQILNAEAGSLLLAAGEDNREMVFRVAIGGTGSDLIGKRVPSNRGLIGEVMRTRQAAIVDNTESDQRWQGEITKNDKFRTQSILAVPLIAKDQIIGVLEVLNKRDGTPFVREEVELLSTFAGQAAIAIENARLFQTTESQLNKRLQELETLERIDFELNRTLDITRVGEITVRWSVANSGATAGAIGVVETGKTGSPPHLRVLAMYGYRPDEYPEGADDKRWPLDKGIVKRVMRTLQPDLADVKIDPDYVPMLKGSISQITIPMISGGEVNAILVLETNKEPRFNLLDLTFMQRIAEHASIAVSNAQLVEEIRRAAESKSEFVGFAAHELKNPLTSIKGYSALMMGEMGKMMNEEMRRDSLQVIQSNAERMQSIIDDLRDIAALEADKLKVDLKPIPLAKVVTDTLITFEQRIKDKGQTVVNNVHSELPLVNGDHNRLVQVLTNLVSNAHKYSPEDTTITLTADVNRNFRTRQGQLIGPVVHLKVIDQGIGLSEKDLQRIFREDYFRSDSEQARQQEGTGLGMMITQRFIELHSGKIWVESKLNEGSVFQFVIPIAPGELLSDQERPVTQANRQSETLTQPSSD
ncbi:MAG: GAF domain-containing protein [Anaerolineae bacterium]|nr:GAF domain-containing protein [Anaerolineae bacterium]